MKGSLFQAVAPTSLPFGLLTFIVAIDLAVIARNPGIDLYFGGTAFWARPLTPPIHLAARRTIGKVRGVRKIGRVRVKANILG